jgi:hypothetical protein
MKKKKKKKKESTNCSLYFGCSTKLSISIIHSFYFASNIWESKSGLVGCLARFGIWHLHHTTQLLTTTPSHAVYTLLLRFNFPPSLISLYVGESFERELVPSYHTHLSKVPVVD